MVYPVSHSLSNLNSLSSLNSLIQKVWGISRGAGFASAIPCGELRIESDWYELCEWNLEDGECRSWSYKITGRFETRPGDWGASAGETGSLRKKAEENVQPASALDGLRRDGRSTPNAQTRLLAVCKDGPLLLTLLNSQATDGAEGSSFPTSSTALELTE